MGPHAATILASPWTTALTAAVLLQAAFESFLDALAQPNVIYVLLILGFLGLFLELSAPGASVPGSIGAFFLILAALGLSQLTFDWRGALLMFVAFLLFLVDIFVPSLGALTVTGLALLVFGSYLLFDESQGPAVSRPLIWAMAVSLVALFVVIGGFALTVFRRKPATGREGLVGAVGTVRQSLDPDGFVFVSGELWQATAPGDSPASAAPIEPRTAVTVTGMDGLRLLVRRATAAEADDAGVAVIGDARPAPPSESGVPIPEAP
jgi:membrane-bound serine protease (ClpP class)